MQAVHHSFREADSIVCGLDCITKHIPREWLWGVFLFPCSFPLIFTFLLLHILKQNLIALALLEDVSWDPVCIYWAGTRPVIIQACSQGYFQSYWSFFFLRVYGLTACCTVSKEEQGSGLVADWGRQKPSVPCRPEIQKVPGSLPSFQSTSLALGPMRSVPVCTSQHLELPLQSSFSLQNSRQKAN